jgi:hypothetical protein
MMLSIAVLASKESRSSIRCPLDELVGRCSNRRMPFWLHTLITTLLKTAVDPNGCPFHVLVTRISTRASHARGIQLQLTRPHTEAQSHAKVRALILQL